MPWYVFRISPPGDITEPTDYMRVARRPVSFGTKLGAIQANDNGFGFPIVNMAIMNEIATALNNATESANVCLRVL